MMMVYKYGLLRPSDHVRDAVLAQMRKAHDYQNVLTEIERGRRAAVREAMGGVDAVAFAERAAIEARAEEAEAVAALRAGRAKRRDRKDEPACLARVEAARAQRKEAVATLADARRALREDGAIGVRVAEIDARANELRISAREHCGVYWGTYLLVEMAVDQARKMPLYDGTTPNDPRFRRWTGEGRVGVQVQKGLPSADIHDATNRLVRIDPIDPVAWDPTASRGARRRALGKVADGTQAHLHLRVGSEGRDPVWARFPIVMHRPLPEGSTVKRATVHLRKVRAGAYEREVWSVDLTIDVPTPASNISNAHAVGVDVGWRRMDDGSVRVAFAVGSDGERYDLRLPPDHFDRVRKVEDLASIRSKNADVAREALAAWRYADLSTNALPGWFAKETEHLRAWRSIPRLARLAKRWETSRFQLDEGVFKAFHAWWRRDEHLALWEVYQREGVIRRRDDVFRVFAATLARKYGTIVFEDLDLRDFARRVPAEGEAENETARTMRHAVAVSHCRDALASAFLTRGGSVAKESAVDTTRACHACGHTEAFDAAAELVHVCGGCGTRWDQDENAAINLLRRHRERCERERSGDGGSPGVARGDGSTEKKTDPSAHGETKWEKIRRRRKEKMTAREAADNPTE